MSFNWINAKEYQYIIYEKMEGIAKVFTNHSVARVQKTVKFSTSLPWNS